MDESLFNKLISFSFYEHCKKLYICKKIDKLSKNYKLFSVKKMPYFGICYHAKPIVGVKCHKVEHPLRPIPRSVCERSLEVAAHSQIRLPIDLHLLDLKVKEKPNVQS